MEIGRSIGGDPASQIIWYVIGMSPSLISIIMLDRWRSSEPDNLVC